MILEPGLRNLRKMGGTGRRPGSKSLFVFALLCLIRYAQLSAAHADEALGVSRKSDEQVDGEFKSRVEKVEAGGGGKLDAEMGDAYIIRSSSREIETQIVDDQSSHQTNRRSQAQGVSRRHLSVSVKADTTQTNTNTNTTQTGAGKKSPAPRPPPVKTEMTKNVSAVVTNSSPPPPPDSEVATADRVKGTAATRKTCEVGPVLAKLQATGDDGNDDYTLDVRNDGGKAQLNINIGTTSVLKAMPDKLVLPKGENKQVKISVIDREAAKSGASINISWGEDDCQVNIPRGINIGIVTPPSSYLSYFSSPGVAALVIGGSLTVVLLLGILGAWRCASWRAQARRRDGDVKYQELEMGIPTTAGISSHKDEIPLSADGWDEVWEDDDWQDSEAVRSTSSSLTLSAKGLNSRRANKDGWDSSWDD